jgi:hypothetical protein
MSTTESPKRAASNWNSHHTVILNHPLADVFEKLSSPAGTRAVLELSSLCQQSTILSTDLIVLPNDVPLTSAIPSSLPAVAKSEPGSDERCLQRHAFTFTEHIPLLGGLYTSVVVVAGHQTADPSSRTIIYESQAESAGVTVWRVRDFEEMPGGKTLVKETLEGTGPGWLKWYIQKTARQVHRCVASRQ